MTKIKTCESCGEEFYGDEEFCESCVAQGEIEAMDYGG